MAISCELSDCSFMLFRQSAVEQELRSAQLCPIFLIQSPVLWELSPGTPESFVYATELWSLQIVIEAFVPSNLNIES